MAFLGFVDNKADFFSPLTPAECAKRLEENLGHWWQIGSRADFIGTVSEDGFRARVRMKFRNSDMILRGNFQTCEGGTRIICRFGPPKFAKLFAGLWFTLAFAFIIAVSYSTVAAIATSGWTVPLNKWELLGFSWLFPVFGVAIASFGAWLSRHDEAQLTTFVCQTLNATNVKPMLA